MTLTEEETQLAQTTREDYIRRYMPWDLVELQVIDSLVILEIKLRRLDHLELDTMARLELEWANAQTKYPSQATLSRYRNQLNRERKQSEEQLARLLRQRPTGQNRRTPASVQFRFTADPVEEAGARHPANDDVIRLVKNEPKSPDKSN